MSACAASPDFLTVTVWTFKANGHPGESQVLLQNPVLRWGLSSNGHDRPIFSYHIMWGKKEKFKFQEKNIEKTTPNSNSALIETTQLCLFMILIWHVIDY